MKAKKEARLRGVLHDAQMKAARRVRGLFVDPGHPDYNADTAVPWNEASFGSRAALEMTKGTMALERAKAANGQQEQRSIGLVILPARAESIAEWEQRVKERNQKVIDTTVGPALIEEVKK